MPLRPDTERSGGDDDYCTPPDLLERIRLLGRIDLDPCGNPHSFVEARHTVILEAGETRSVKYGGGLAIDWSSRVDPGGLVYVNPPYGYALPIWAAKILFFARQGLPIVTLVPARVETDWYKTIVECSTAEHFFSKRIQFWRHGRKTDQARFPSALLTANVPFELVREVFRGQGRTNQLDQISPPSDIETRKDDPEMPKSRSKPRKAPKVPKAPKAKPTKRRASSSSSSSSSSKPRRKLKGNVVRTSRRKPAAGGDPHVLPGQHKLPHVETEPKGLSLPPSVVAAMGGAVMAAAANVIAEAAGEFPAIDTGKPVRNSPILIRFDIAERQRYEQLARARNMRFAEFVRHVLARFAAGLERQAPLPKTA